MNLEMLGINAVVESLLMAPGDWMLLFDDVMMLLLYRITDRTLGEEYVKLPDVESRI